MQAFWQNSTLSLLSLNLTVMRFKNIFFYHLAKNSKKRRQFFTYVNVIFNSCTDSYLTISLFYLKLLLYLCIINADVFYFSTKSSILIFAMRNILLTSMLKKPYSSTTLPSMV